MSETVKDTDQRKIEVKALARVEGEGGLRIVFKDGKVEEAVLNIFEPPRFYEAFLRGREYREVPDITARICGICPVAYQMSSCHALERAMGVSAQVDPGIRTLRTLLYCGEWIESHVLHIFMLHLPDFLGYESAISMAEDHRDTVVRALRLKKIGNLILDTLGGRAVHPVNVCVGGFYSLPDPERWNEILPDLRQALEDMSELTLFLAENLEYPDFDVDYEFVALRPADEYPMNQGGIASSKGIRIDQEDFLEVIEEKHVEHSNSLHAVMKGRGPYLVGPLARLNLNADRLHPKAAELLPKVCDAIGKDLPWKNNFLSLPARAIETVHAIALAIDILEDYPHPHRSRVPIEPRAGVGAAATEAPRGILWHRYETDPEGLIRSAHIIPPTSQNQGQIEHDLRYFAERLADLEDEELGLKCETLIRNYDPCISCATHFLKLDVERL